ncbi:MAG: EAL domain-containing protein [Steroidobacteraceae bacterium]
MSESVAVPLVVASQARDPVEALNSLLRRNGIPAHCTWIPGLQDLPEALEQLNPELLICVTHDGSELATVAGLREKAAPDVPLLVVRPQIDEEIISADLALGARDSLSLACPARMQAVIERELKACRMERALNRTLRSAQDYRKQLETVLTRSNDAIARVQEGILVDANTSWLELIAAPDADSIVGQPIMDFFDEANHVALKGALVACQQGRWSDHSLRVDLQTGDGSALSLELVLSLGEHDGEPCVHLIVPAQKRDERRIGDDLAEAVRRNPHSGLLYRRPLLETLQSRTAAAPQGGARYLVGIQPDRYEELERELGMLRSEEFIAALAAVLRAHAAPTDVLGHFNGAGMLALIERGTARDAELWAERLVEKVRQHRFEIGDRGFNATISSGLAVVPSTSTRLEDAIADAIESMRRAAKRGGNQLAATARADTDARVQSYDSVWVKHIKAALESGRFRLVQQPIANLAGEGMAMSDMLVRMVDTQDKEVLPSEFMPAAERNGLLRPIDRWVLAAAVKFSRRKPCCLFVRLSRESAADTTLLPWLTGLFKELQADPQRLCIEITEDIASKIPGEVGRLALGLRALGVKFALEHFGVGLESANLLTSLPLDFVKIDGSLMQGLTEDQILQDKVRSLVEAAAERHIGTIAERVEDANTMAVLWQIGVQHLQGYLIQAPEEVVIGAKG